MKTTSQSNNICPQCGASVPAEAPEGLCPRCVLAAAATAEPPPTATAQAEPAAKLGMTESAVKVAIHRLRKKFRDAIRAEIAQTLGEGGAIDDELRYLVEILARG
jgi:predicted amidophosphoribosyltransferase